MRSVHLTSPTQELCAKESKWTVYIEKDLHRTYKMHELFAEEGGLGQREMCKVLKAYSLYNSKVGYCQVCPGWFYCEQCLKYDAVEIIIYRS